MQKLYLLQLFTKIPQLIDISHVSKRGSSLRITVPKRVQSKLGIKEEDILGYYEDDGKVILKKME